MRYVSKHSGQNFIFFVFLYFVMLCAMFQNIAVKISFSLYFFILLCYALCFKTWRSKFIFFVFLYFAMLYATHTFRNMAVKFFSIIFLCYVLVLCFET